MNTVTPLRRFWHLREDPRPVPPLARRRVLVVVISAVQVAVLALIAFVSPMFLLLGVLTWPLTVWFSRSATRNMTTAPNADLDEWQRGQVLRAYRTAFLVVSTTVLVVGIVLANLVLTFELELPPVGFDRIAALLFVLGLYTVPWAPAAALAWRLPDEQVESADGVAVHP